MLTVDEARRRIVGGIRTVSAEWVLLDHGLDRVLADDLRALRTHPPTAVSAMDGYAVRAEDTRLADISLEVVGENRAGATAVTQMGPGSAVRIFTGGVLPAGADAVAIQENALTAEGRVRFTRPAREGEFVRRAGLDFEAGAVGLSAGMVLGPRALGLAAAMGHVWLPVRRRPRIALFTTGDELARPGEPAEGDRIVSSNSTTIGSYIRRWGGQPVDLGIAPDTVEATAEILNAAERVDLIVSTGGASVGDYDVIQRTLGERGFALDFWKIAMRPGKPMMFGRIGTTPLLGLPGNPVSASVCAILFVRAALHALLGLDPALPTLTARTARPLRANDEREDYLRARFVEGEGPDLWVSTAERQDSSMLGVLAGADALLRRPPHAGPLEQGAAVEVVPLRACEHLGPQAQCH